MSVPVASAATGTVTAPLTQPAAMKLAGSKAPTVTSAAAKAHHDTAASGSTRLADGQLARRATVDPAVFSAQATPAAAGGAMSAASAAAGTPGYTPVTPYRVLDTRYGTGAAKAAVGPRGFIDVKVTGLGGVPASGVDAVVVNVTVTAPTVGGWVAVYPTGAAAPTASNLNFTRGLTIANLVIAKVGTNGSIRLYNYAGSTHLIGDIAGYMATGSKYTAQTPVRILDTRYGTGAAKGKVLAGQSVDLKVAGVGGVPASGVSAVAMNVTATGVTAASYITVYPSGTTRPTTSNLNMVAGQTVPVLVMATLGSTGNVSLYNNLGGADLIADLAGWYTTGGEYHALTPNRIFDSRQGFGALPAGGGVDLPISGWGGVPMTGDSAVVVSVTAVTPSSGGYLSVFPYTTATTPPKSSTLNFNKGANVPNLAIVKVGPGGWISVYNPYGNTHVIVDVVGWFSTTQVQGLGVQQTEATSRGVDGELLSTYTVDGVSSDGRYTLFTHGGTTGTPYPTSENRRLLVRDSVLGITTEVAASGTAAVTGLGLSSDGRFALWKSAASFVTGDTNGVDDVYVTDLTSGWWYLVAFNEATQSGGNGATSEGSISPSGQYVSIISAASNLTAGDTDGTSDAFVVDMWAATANFTLIAPAAAGGITTRAVADNGTVTYTVGSSLGTVYVWDNVTKVSTAISPPASGIPTASDSIDSGQASISADGRYVAFLTTAALDSADTNSSWDVYLRDRTVGADTFVTTGTTGTGANAYTQGPMISADGSVVAFASSATNLVSTPILASKEVFLYSRTAKTTTVVSRTPAGAMSLGLSYFVQVSGTGRYVAYQTDSTVLFPENVVNLAPSALTRVS